MGLLLSILVSCVGVVELIAFYSDLRRGLRVVDPEDSDLETVTCNYKRMLNKEYREVFAEVNGNVAHKEVNTNFLLSTSPKTIFNPEAKPKNIQNTTCLDVNSIPIRAQINSANCVHETNNVLKLETTNVKPSPIQEHSSNFEHSESHTSEAIRAKSIIIESEVNIDHKINHTMLYEGTNQTLKLETTNVKPSPIQIDTSNFEHKANHIADTISAKSITIESEPNVEHKINPTSLHETTNLGTIPVEVDPYNLFFDTNDIEIPSIIEEIYFLEEPLTDPVHGDRSPSPYPTYERLVHIGTIHSEFLEDPTLSLIEVEEDDNNAEVELNILEYSYRRQRSKSRSPSKHRSRSPSPQYRRSVSPINKPKLRIQEQRRHRSVSPCKPSLEEDPTPHLHKRRRSKSSSDLCRVLVCKPPSDYQLVIGNYWQRCPSPFDQLLTENVVLTENAGQLTQPVLVEDIFSDDFKNSLDGVKSKNPNEERKREFKRKRSNRNRLSQSSLDSNDNSKENVQNVSLKESLLEFGGHVEKEPSSSTFSSVLPGQNIMCEKSAGFAIPAEEKASSSTFSSTILSSENVAYDKSTESGAFVEEKASSSTFSPTILSSQNDICEKSTENTNAIYEGSVTDYNMVPSNVIADTSSKPIPSKEEKKPEPFWVN